MLPSSHRHPVPFGVPFAVPFNEVTAPLYLVAALITKRLPFRSEKGQATAEYALVLLGAIGVAIALFAYLKQSDQLRHIVDKLFGKITKELDRQTEP